MLTRSTSPHHRTGFRYACPVAFYIRLDKNYPKYPINLDFYACPRKFAEIHHYVDDERLTASLEKYRTMSAAKIDYSYSQNFVNEVKRLCEEYHLSLNFKRRRLNGSDDEDSIQEDVSKDRDDNTDHAPVEQRSTQLKIDEREG
jgi:hypothetical protein